MGLVRPFTTTDDHRYRAAERADQDHGLSRHDHRINALRGQLHLPGNLGLRARHQYTTRVEAALATINENPFPPPSDAINDGIITIGTTATGPFRLTATELTQHVLISGPTGTGKTTLVTSIIQQARAHGVHVLLIDYKHDYETIAATDPDVVIIHPDLPLNLLQHDPLVGRQDHIDLVNRCLARSFYGGEHLKQAIHDTLNTTYDRFHTPSVRDWYDTTNTLNDKKDTYARRDALTGLSHRLRRLIDQYPRMTSTHQGMSHETLAHHSLYVGANRPNETTDFLASIIVSLCHDHAARQQQRNTLNRLLILDEGLLTFGDNNRIDGPVLLPLIPLLREYGTSVIITTAHLSGINETLRNNTGTTIQLPLANHTDLPTITRTLGLNNDQRDAMTRLVIGNAIVRTTKHDQPFLLSFDPPTNNKTLNPNDWEAARKRSNQHGPQQTPTTPTAKQPTVENTSPEPTTQRRPPPLPTTVARVPIVALTPPQERLLQVIVDATITTSTPAYRKSNLSLSAGDNAATHLETLGLINRTPIIARDGRGGRAIALTPTTAGYERLRTPRPHGPRGGSNPQHAYLINELSRRLPTANVEYRVGTKSIDLLTTATPQNQAVLQKITGTQLALGSLVAIEVETTNDTLSNNITKNFASGITHHISAVMPKHVTSAQALIKHTVPVAQQPCITVINVFSLINALEEP